MGPLSLVTHDRIVAWTTTARIREITVADTVCGVDVSKDWLDAHIAPVGAFKRFANTDAGIAELAAFCHTHATSLGIVEASGGYERGAWSGLWKAGVQTARVNPRMVRDFARGIGLIEKTDRIDAAVLAEFGQARGSRLIVAPPSEGKARRLESLSSRLRQITSDITINKQRLAAASDRETCDSIDAVLELLEGQSRKVVGELASLIDDDDEYRHIGGALREVKNVADRTVIVLLSEMPEIGTISGKKVAKLAGLAPIANDSGKRRGKRKTRGGRANVRRILFTVANGAAKYHAGLADLKRRMAGDGKPKMAIRIALARKLLVILNAKARDARRDLAGTT